MGSKVNRFILINNEKIISCSLTTNTKRYQQPVSHRAPWSVVAGAHWFSPWCLQSSTPLETPPGQLQTHPKGIPTDKHWYSLFDAFSHHNPLHFSCYINSSAAQHRGHLAVLQNCGVGPVLWNEFHVVPAAQTRTLSVLAHLWKDAFFMSLPWFSGMQPDLISAATRSSSMVLNWEALGFLWNTESI